MPFPRYRKKMFILLSLPILMTLKKLNLCHYLTTRPSSRWRYRIPWQKTFIEVKDFVGQTLITYTAERSRSRSFGLLQFLRKSNPKPLDVQSLGPLFFCSLLQIAGLCFCQIESSTRCIINRITLRCPPPKWD